jgi:pimeloyl-ACP methyl ester carboxylesterase
MTADQDEGEPLLNYERRGDGPALVLIHGFGGCWQHWDPVLDALAEKRDVIAIDLPGFGASPRWPRQRRFGIEPLVDAVERFIESLGLERPHVAGNSLGGIVSLELANRRAVRSATVLSPAAFVDGVSKLYVAGLLCGLQGLSLAVPPCATDAVIRMGPMRDGVASLLVRRPRAFSDESLRVSADSIRHAPLLLRHALRLNYEFRASKNFDVPVTVAWGTHDRVLWTRQVRAARRALPGAHMVPLPNCGHVPMSDNPRLVARVLLDGSRDAA